MLAPAMPEPSAVMVRATAGSQVPAPALSVLVRLVVMARLHLDLLRHPEAIILAPTAVATLVAVVAALLPIITVFTVLARLHAAPAAIVVPAAVRRRVVATLAAAVAEVAAVVVLVAVREVAAADNPPDF